MNAAKVISYYLLADGKIVEDEPTSTPSLIELLSVMVQPK